MDWGKGENPMAEQTTIVARWKSVGNDIDFRFYTEDGTPIMGRGGVNRDGEEYHLGQISSNMAWAMLDAHEHFREHLTEMFPGGYVIHFEMEVAETMADRIPFDRYYTLDTGSVVRLRDDIPPREGGIVLHFINPLLSPDDAPATLTYDNEAGKNTTIRLSDDAADHLMLLLMERREARNAQNWGKENG